MLQITSAGGVFMPHSKAQTTTFAAKIAQPRQEKNSTMAFIQFGSNSSMPILAMW